MNTTPNVPATAKECERHDAANERAPSEGADNAPAAPAREDR
jgi:hypothetical protein